MEYIVAVFLRLHVCAIVISLESEDRITQRTLITFVHALWILFGPIW